MKRFTGVTLAIALVLVLLPAARPAIGEDDLPPGDTSLVRVESDDRPMKEVMKLVAAATKWQIFCTSQAGARTVVLYGQNIMAGELLKSIVKSQNLVYRVEGNAIYIMTPDEYNEAYGGFKEVIHLTHAPAEKVAQALTPLLASKTGKVTALPEASTVLVYDSPANMTVILDMVAKLDQPLQTRVVQLENAPAAQVATALRQFVSQMGVISADEQSNQIIISDGPGKVESLADLAAKMDVQPNRTTRCFALANAECATVAQYLADMFGLRTGSADESQIRRPAPQAASTQTEGASAQPPQGGQAAPAPTRRQQPLQQFLGQRRAAEPDLSAAGMGTVIADLRTNSVWVTDTPERVDQIGEVIVGLDAALETRTYRFSYADPSQLDLDGRMAGILLSPFDHYEVDQRTRTVTLTTTRERLAKAVGLFEEWDVKPRQVFITGKILAVNRDHLRDVGVHYEALIHQMDENVDTEIQVGGSFLPIIPATPKGAIRFGDVVNDNFTVLIEMLESDSTTRLLSSPRVLVTDGSRATFFVATEEPYTEIVVDGNTQTTLENVKFKKIGVTLDVQPTIAVDGRISMLIALEVSSLQEFRNGVPVVSTSLVTSSVVVADGRPLVIGGLISDQDVEAVSKVPILGDIPLLGALFRNSKTDRSQREIVLIVVPSIVGQESQDEIPTLSQIEDELKADRHLLDDDSSEMAEPVSLEQVPAEGE